MVSVSGTDHPIPSHAVTRFLIPYSMGGPGYDVDDHQQREHSFRDPCFPRRQGTVLSTSVSVIHSVTKGEVLALFPDGAGFKFILPHAAAIGAGTINNMLGSGDDAGFQESRTGIVHLPEAR
jgi:hypothetical protein